MDMAVRDLPARTGRTFSSHRGRPGLGSLALRFAAATAVTALGSARTTRHERAPAKDAGHGAHVHAARQINRAAGLLAASVLADSAVEHYRGSFQNRAMYAPLAASTLSLAASGHGAGDVRASTHRVRDGIYTAALLTGLAGTGFHLYNVGKRPGGVSWLNLFYGAPLGAPAALVLSGMLGMVAERVRDNPGDRPPTVWGVPAGRAVAAATAAGLVGTIAEVGLLHFRGAYHNPLMYVPVTVPPVSAALLAEAAVGPRRRRPLVRRWLTLTAWVGVAGALLHVVGVARNMGGWRNWSQNILNGPPIPAPPSFTALSIAGLGALDLLEDAEHE